MSEFPANDTKQSNESKLPLIGGIAVAIGTAVCCVGPLVLLSLGISGAWIGSLTLLAPYRPILIVIVLALFGWAGWQVYRPVERCEPGTACAVPQVRRNRQIIFWTSALIASVFVTSVWWLPLIA